MPAQVVRKTKHLPHLQFGRNQSVRFPYTCLMLIDFIVASLTIKAVSFEMKQTDRRGYVAFGCLPN